MKQLYRMSQRDTIFNALSATSPVLLSRRYLLQQDKGNSQTKILIENKGLRTLKSMKITAPKTVASTKFRQFSLYLPFKRLELLIQLRKQFLRLPRLPFRQNGYICLIGAVPLGRIRFELMLSYENLIYSQALLATQHLPKH